MEATMELGAHGEAASGGEPERKRAAARIRAKTVELNQAAVNMRDQVEARETKMRRFSLYRLWAALRDSIAVH